MGFQVSPGVDVREIDLTNVIPAVSTTIGGIAGRFQWGPVDKVNLVTDEAGLVDLHFKPNDDTFRTFFTAANFLSYGNALRVVRVGGTAAKNAGFYATGASESGTIIPNTATGAESGYDGTNTVTGMKVVTPIQKSAYGTYEGSPTGAVASVNNANDDTLVDSPPAVHVLAKYPGELGNSLRVIMYNDGTATGPHFDGTFYDLDGSDSASTTGSLNVLFNAVPNDTTYQTVGGSEYVVDRGGRNDEVNVAVIDHEGRFSGVPGTVLETFELLSLCKGATKAQGSSAYIVDVLNRSSRYIGVGSAFKWGSTTVTAGTATTAWDTGYVFADLTGGADGTAPTAGDYYTKGEKNGYALLEDAETVDVSLLLYGGADDESSGTFTTKDHTPTVAQKLVEIAEDRKDCVAFVSPNFWCTDPANTTTESVRTQNVVDWRKTAWNKSTSYAVVDSGHKYQYDPYNDVFRYVPLNGDVAGLCVRTDEQTDPWFSPAGFNRGQINRVARLALNPRQAQRDDLYVAGVNPVVSFPGQGTLLFGDKTALAKPSAFDRINVRRLFIVLEKAIATAAKFQLFELNDEFTRAQFVSIVNPFLRDIKGRRGIYDFLVVCDETNNTPEVIDGNRFVADIFIKPARSINFMTLNFIATRTGVSFSEVAGV